MKRLSSLSVCLILAAAATFAQPDPAPPADPPAFSAGPITFGGLVDGYYSLNFNHPASRINTLRNFDTKANQFGLNFAKLSMQHSTDPVGFTVELAAGPAMDIFHATEPAGPEVVKHLFQGYVSVRPETWKGFQFDFGKFVTSAGAEVTETHLNWNYSRSLLYANGPYYHFGGRASMPLSENFTIGAQLVNGWNNVQDNNSGKTVGLTAAFTTPMINWTNTYYVGNEKDDIEDGVRIDAPGLRHFYDTVVLVNPAGNVNLLFNFDYGVDRLPGGRDNVFYGYSIATRFAANEKFSVSPRYDWYKDRDGFITGQVQTLQEFTLTADYRLPRGFVTKLEYRRDWSNVPFFDRGNDVMNARTQNTLLAGFMVVF